MCLGFFEVCIRSRSRNWLELAKSSASGCVYAEIVFAYFFRQNDWGKSLRLRGSSLSEGSAKSSEFKSDPPRPFIFGFRFPVFCTYEVEVLELENLDCQLLRPLSSLSIWPLRNWNFVERVVIADVVVKVDFFVVVELVT